MRLHILATVMVLLIASSATAQVLKSEDGPRVANKAKSGCTDNACSDSGGCATCLRFTVYVPLDAQQLKVRCYTVANYPVDYPHGNLHEVACGQDVAWSIFSSPNISTTPNNKTITTVFYNRSDDRDRDAKVVVEYQKPAQVSEPEWEPPDLSGNWLGPGNQTISISRDGRFRFSVAPPGRGPFLGRFSDRSSIVVDFADASSPCCSGNLLNDNTRINWSNGTYWTKVVGATLSPPDISGKWRGPGGHIITISRQSISRFSVTPPGRGPFQGRFNSDSSIVIDFTDDPSSCCTGILENGGKKIKWSNGTSWTKTD